MYALDELAAEAEGFRASFARGEGFRPLYVKIKLLFGCNLRCQMCNHWRDARPKQLSTARLTEILTELAALGCRKVHFTGGEPGLRPDLEQLVAAASAVGIRPTLTSNGTLFTRERARRIVEAGLRGINVSIDSPDPSVHDTIRGVPGSWQQSIDGLKNLRKESRHGKLSLAINTVVTRLNYETLLDLPRLAVRLGVRALHLLPVDEHTGIPLRPAPEEIARFNSEIAPELATRGLRAGLFRSEDEAYPFGRSPAEVEAGSRGDYALGYYRARPCFAPFTHALLEHDGRVFVCCMTRGLPALGSVAEQSFTQTWQGVAFHGVREAMKTPEKLAPCHRCDDFLDENQRMFEILTDQSTDRSGPPQRSGAPERRGACGAGHEPGSSAPRTPV